MPLLEIVRGRDTSPRDAGDGVQARQDAAQERRPLGQRVRLHRQPDDLRLRCAKRSALAEEGVTPARIDARDEALRLSDGPVRDVRSLRTRRRLWHIAKAARRAGRAGARTSRPACRDEAPRTKDDGRLFQVRQIRRQRARADSGSGGRAALRGGGATRRASRRAPSTDAEIRDRLLGALIDRGKHLLEEGVALRPGDIDIVYVYGYGFPPHRGGPMWYSPACVKR